MLAVLSFLIVVTLLVRYFTGNTDNEIGNQEFVGSRTKAGAVINSMVRIIAVAVTIGLVAIPEGLSWAVAVILAYSGNRMMADKVIVRKRSACETMGSATTICILTLNQMKVTKFWLGQDPIGEDANSSSIAPNVLNLIQQGVALNTTGSVYRATSGSNTEFCGSPSEKALLSWASLKLGMEMEKLKQNYTILLVESFNSENSYFKFTMAVFRCIDLLKPTLLPSDLEVARSQVFSELLSNSMPFSTGFFCACDI